MGDFTGFTFGGKHSFNDLKITRVSGGDRYDEELHPEIKDVAAEVPGVNGEYYFGSTYGPKTIDIEIAFDHLTEVQFRNLKKVFGTREVKELIFDERPYKKYMAKLESPIKLSYICFDEPKKHIDTSGSARGVRRVEQTHTENVVNPITGNPTEETIEVTERVRETIYPYVKDEGTERIYKGEGQITFICHFPFAKSVYKVLPEGSDDWAISSGILSATEYANIDTYSNNKIDVYNGGDLETGFRLYLPAAAATTVTTLSYKVHSMDTNPTAVLALNAITLKGSDVGVLVDTINELVVGVSSFTYNLSGNAVYTTSGNIYNEYVDSGYFFHLEPNERYDGSTIQITGGAQGIEIFYDYLYF